MIKKSKKKIEKKKYSFSIYMLYLGTNKKYDEVEEVHNFVFKGDLEKNINDIFSGEKLKDGAFYVHIPTKADPSMAPEGKEGLYVLLPVSDLSTAKYEWNEETIQHYRNYLIQEMKKIKGFEKDRKSVV